MRREEMAASDPVLAQIIAREATGNKAQIMQFARTHGKPGVKALDITGASGLPMLNALGEPAIKAITRKNVDGAEAALLLLEAHETSRARALAMANAIVSHGSVAMTHLSDPAIGAHVAEALEKSGPDGLRNLNGLNPAQKELLSRNPQNVALVMNHGSLALAALESNPGIARMAARTEPEHLPALFTAAIRHQGSPMPINWRRLYAQATRQTESRKPKVTKIPVRREQAGGPHEQVELPGDALEEMQARGIDANMVRGIIYHGFAHPKGAVVGTNCITLKKFQRNVLQNTPGTLDEYDAAMKWLKTHQVYAIRPHGEALSLNHESDATPAGRSIINAVHATLHARKQ